MRFCKLIVFVLTVFLLVGCSSEKKVKTCKIVSDQSASGYKITTKYDIYSKKDIVTRVESTEIVDSDQKEILDFYQKEYESMYKKYNKTYGGYTYDIDISNNKLTCNVTIDYKKFDRKQYIKDNTGLKKFVNKDKYFTVEGITEMYQNMGGICK